MHATKSAMPCSMPSAATPDGWMLTAYAHTSGTGDLWIERHLRVLIHRCLDKKYERIKAEIVSGQGLMYQYKLVY